MKSSVYFFAATLFVGGSIITGCKNTPENEEAVVEERRDEPEIQPDYTVTAQEFKNETNEKIADNDRRIEELKEEIARDKEELREARKARLTELEQRNMEMKKRIAEYQDKGKAEWEEFKREFEHDMDELGKALKDLTVNNEK